MYYIIIYIYIYIIYLYYNIIDNRNVNTVQKIGKDVTKDIKKKVFSMNHASRSEGKQ